MYFIVQTYTDVISQAAFVENTLYIYNDFLSLNTCVSPCRLTNVRGPSHCEVLGTSQGFDPGLHLGHFRYMNDVLYGSV